jgi:hypothetical protein
VYSEVAWSGPVPFVVLSVEEDVLLPGCGGGGGGGTRVRDAARRDDESGRSLWLWSHHSTRLGFSA